MLWSIPPYAVLVPRGGHAIARRRQMSGCPYPVGHDRGHSQALLVRSNGRDESNSNVLFVDHTCMLYRLWPAVIMRGKPLPELEGYTHWPNMGFEESAWQTHLSETVL